VLVLPGLRVVQVRVTADRRATPQGVAEPSLFPESHVPVGQPEALPILDSRARDAIFYEQRVGSIINPPESTGMGFWSINPYVGCEFGCTYCYARFTHRYAVERAEGAGRLDRSAMGIYRGSETWKAFEHRIFVKRRESVLGAMDRDLIRVTSRRAGGEAVEIVLGTATDPYQPAERTFQLSRLILQRLSRERGLSVTIISKSPLICRDIDVLTELQQNNALSIHVSLITTDVQLIRLLEARSPMPHARLRALARLSAAGLNAGLIVAPVLPGINDSVRLLDRLLAAGKAARTRFAFPAPLRLYASIREQFLPIIEQHFPHLAPRYRAAYRGFGHAPDSYARALGRRFRKIAMRHGVPVHTLRSPASSMPAPTGDSQLGLWTRALQR
jgi:DNA repair photolyase